MGCQGQRGHHSPILPQHTPHVITAADTVPAVPSTGSHPQPQRPRGLPPISGGDGVGALTQAGPIQLSGTQRQRGVPLGGPGASS